MTVLDNIHQYDERLLLWCQKSRYYPSFIYLMRMISRSGDGYVHFCLPALYLLLLPAQGIHFFTLCLIAFSIERPIYFVLKNVLKRQRPPSVIPDFQSIVTASDKFSFPSGHTMAAFLVAGLYSLYFQEISITLYIWASLVACSRVVLGVHFPTDTLAGASLGTFIAFMAMSL